MRKYILPVLGIVVGVASIMFFCLYLLLGSLERFNETTEETIFTIETGAPIFFKARSLGIGGACEIIMSQQPIEGRLDSLNHYVFYTSEIYYRQDWGRITIYAPSHSIVEPLNDFDGITVFLERVQLSESLNDYDINYQQYGLCKVSVP